jgi:hypothetical protein
LSDDIKKYIPFEGNDNFRKASIVENPPINKGEQDVEVIRVIKEKCHKGEAMDDDGNIYTVEGKGCPYDGMVLKRYLLVTDAKGEQREREQANYYCYRCREDFETYAFQPKARSISEVMADAQQSKKRHDPYVADRTKIQWSS